jgi:hypothetical protein
MEYLQQILDFYRNIYPSLQHVILEFVEEIDDLSDLCGSAKCDLIGEYQYERKIRYKNIIPIKIQIVNTNDEYKNKVILFHELAHCICRHIEIYVKNKWIIFDHSNEFYDKYLETFEIAINNKFITTKYNNLDHKILKHIDEFI